jgi:hypothetical protein
MPSSSGPAAGIRTKIGAHSFRATGITTQSAKRRQVGGRRSRWPAMGRGERPAPLRSLETMPLDEVERIASFKLVPWVRHRAGPLYVAAYPSRAASCRRIFARKYNCCASFSAISCRRIAKRLNNDSGSGEHLLSMPEVFSTSAK